MDKNRAKEKIRKLLAMASDKAASETEAEIAIRQAEAIMRTFGIEEAEIRNATRNSANSLNWDSSFTAYGAERQPALSIPEWYDYIAVGVAVFTDTIVKRHYHNELGFGHAFYGEESDVVFAVWLAEYLKKVVWVNVRKLKGFTRPEKNDFRKAMAGRLQARMKQLRKERNAVFKDAESVNGKGTALIIVGEKLALRDEQFGAPTYEERAFTLRSLAAHAAGLDAANSVNLNKPIEPPKRQAMMYPLKVKIA